MSDIDKNSVNLLHAILQGYEYMRQSNLALENAKNAVETAQKVINQNPHVLLRKTCNIKELIDSLKETETEIEENTFNILIWFSENETGN